jgi:hypothetical protein
MKLSRFVTGFVAVALMAFVVSDALGQGRRGGGRGGPGGGFQGRGGGFAMGMGGRGVGDMKMRLLRVEEVKTELEVSPAQDDAIEKLMMQMGERLREQFGGDRPDFRNMNEDEQREFFDKMRKQAEERAAERDSQLEEVLLPQQLERLDQIALQRLGVQALEDEEVAGKLKITDTQKQKMTEVQESLRERMREAFQGGGGRENIRETFGKIREEIEKELLAVLTSDQQKQFEEMKGEKFDMPEGALGAFGRGPGGPGGGFRGGPGGGPGGPGGPGGRRRGGGRPEAE